MTETAVAAAMTPLKYVRESGVATTAEILGLKKSDPKGFDYLMQCARDEMTFKGIAFTEGAK